MAKRRKRGDWLVAGGAIGEAAHCTRCGEGLRLRMPIRIEVMVGALDGFEKAHLDCVDRGWVEPEPTTPEEWATSRDVGVSSATVYAVMTGNPALYDRFDTPKDPSDFGRCYRLLKRFPQWRARLPEVAAAHPAWVPLVESWGELVALFEAEEASGTCPQLYAALNRTDPWRRVIL